MENEDINKAIAYLADKVSKYHERLLAMERDVERHVKDNLRAHSHCVHESYNTTNKWMVIIDRRTRWFYYF